MCRAIYDWIDHEIWLTVIGSDRSHRFQIPLPKNPLNVLKITGSIFQNVD